jgi:hypothetical protein
MSSSPRYCKVLNTTGAPCHHIGTIMVIYGGSCKTLLTFSRVSKEFAVSDLGQLIHQDKVAEYLSGELIGHISKRFARTSTGYILMPLT